MKYCFLLIFAASFILIGCNGNSEEAKTQSEKKEASPKLEPTCEHILTEAYEEQRSIHYFDTNVIVYDRMIMRVGIDENGALRLNGRSSSFEELKSEMHQFYFANKDLGQRMTNVYRNNEYYEFKHYPFFNYFDKAGFKSFLDRLELMAKTDSTARRHYTNHHNRFKSFAAVDEGEELPFLDFGALISIQYEEETDPVAISEAENKIAEFICDFRDEIAQEEFYISYQEIRENASENQLSAAYRLVYLQEMVPAYIMKGKQLSSVAMEEPVLLPPPPPVERIEIMENEDIPID